ncbi:MAG: isoaspartyl peptidase/L-asparaginase, partial [Chitinophagaceae bacterium]
FNAGRGSSLNNLGQIEMDAAVMDGRTLNAGAIACATQIKNPVSLARVVMEHTPHILLTGPELHKIAKRAGLALHSQNYFITAHQRETYLKAAAQITGDGVFRPGSHGTVGAVALDFAGNIAAATSTGGTEGRMPGRISDSCIIGAGCYANNSTCAVSGTGDGEILIRNVSAHTIACVMENPDTSLQQACDDMVHKRVGNGKGDIGVISLNGRGEFGISFNSERMPRVWKNSNGEHGSAIYVTNG